MSDSSSTTEVPWADLKCDFIRHLSKVESSGSYATYGVFETFPPPGISVDEVGDIPTKLDQQSAQSLIKVSDKAPFGKGHQTLVDETVRKTWEIAGSKVSFRNTAWHDWFKDVVERVAKELGVASPKNVRAELYKMLLYEEGAMFKPHKDTEKTRGMFGTLVICLPSIHLGGTVQVTHGENQQKFATDKTSEFNISYTAFYADVTHEILPVQSGHRWVLTYNLIKTSPIFPESAKSLDDRKDDFLKILSKWDDLEGEGPLALCYALDHQYTNMGISLASLKGVDYPRACLVVDCCRETNRFNVFFASMQKVVAIAVAEEEEEITQTRLQIEYVVHSGGFRPPGALEMSDSLLIQNNLYNSRHPDVDMGARYLGNQYSDVEQIYNDTVMIVIPKRSTAFFLLGGRYNYDRFKNFLEGLQQCFRIEDKDPFVRELIVQACKDGLRKSFREDKTENLLLGPVAVAAIIIRDEGLFKRAVDALTHAFDENTSRVLGGLISLQTPVIPIEDLTKAFCKPPMYKLYRSLQAFCEAYGRKLVDQLDNKHANLLTSWKRDRLSKALESATNVYPLDAPVLIEIAKEYNDETLNECVRVFTTRFLTTSDLVNACAVEILSFSQSSIADKDLVARLFPLVQDSAVAQFELQQYSSDSKWPASAYRDFPYSSWPNDENIDRKETKAHKDARNVVDLYQRVFQSDQTTALKLLDKIQSQTESITLDELKRLVIPLLIQMLQVVDKSSTEACKFYQTMMTTYIMRSVQKEPEKPKDWSRPDEEISNCCSRSCVDCAVMKEFLMDPEKQSHEFDSLENPDHFYYRTIGSCRRHRKGPSKLTVTKTTKAWERAHTEWERRASAAQAAFQSFPQPELKQCLGIHYEAIMDLRVVKVHNNAPPPDATDTAADHVTTSSEAAPARKRKHSDSGS